jgi:hypothetical protein
MTTTSNPIVKVKITNALTGEVRMEHTVDNTPSEKLDVLFQGLQFAFPDCFVNMDSSDGSFYAGQPRNMYKDGELWKAGLISWEEYATKWCPNVL